MFLYFLFLLWSCHNFLFDSVSVTIFISPINILNLFEWHRMRLSLWLHFTRYKVKKKRKNEQKLNRIFHSVFLLILVFLVYTKKGKGNSFFDWDLFSFSWNLWQNNNNKNRTNNWNWMATIRNGKRWKIRNILYFNYYENKWKISIFKLNWNCWKIKWKFNWNFVLINEW